MTNLSTTPGDTSAVESEGDLVDPPAGGPGAEYLIFAELGLAFFGAVLKRPLNL